jgi:hypothetical protein
MTAVSTLDRSRAAAGSAGYLPTPSELGDVAGHRTAVPEGYGVPTYPFRVMEHDRARRGPTYPPRIKYGTWPRAEGDLPLQNYGTWGRGGYRPTPSESRNGGTGAYHPWQRNATVVLDAFAPHGGGGVVGGCIRDPRTKTSYASWLFGKLAVQSS